MQRSIADDKSISAETEVAKLYADVQQMPDGREKSRLLKQVRVRLIQGITVIIEDWVSFFSSRSGITSSSSVQRIDGNL